MGTFEEAYQKISEVGGIESASNQAKMKEWANLIEEYKKIINAQQYKFIRQEQQLKILEMK